MRKKFVHIQKTIKISEQQVKLLNEIMETGVFAVEADIFRQGLALMHKKFTTPEYLKDTPAASVKREKIHKEKVFRSIPDEEFAMKEMEDIYILTDEENKKWVLWRKVGNFVGATPLEEIKDWVKSGDPEYNYHKSVAGQGHEPYEEELKNDTIRKILVENYGVAITL